MAFGSPIAGCVGHWLGVAALASSAVAHAASPSPACTSTSVQGEFAPQGVDVRTLSKTLHPGDDFFDYANERWLRSTAIPPGYWDYGQTSILIEKVTEQIKGLITASVASNSQPHSAARQVGDTYASFLDLVRIERVGSKGLEAELASILNSKTPSDLARWMAHPTSSSIIAINVFPVAGEWLVHLDQQNLSQPMLGLPGREFYERTENSYSSTRAAYQTHIATVFELAGVDRPSVRAERVLALETKIAANQWTLEKLRNRKANFHPMSVDALTRYAPGFPWRAFLERRGVGKIQRIVLGTDTAVQAQARLFAGSPLEDWRSYLAFHWIQNQIDVLPQAFRESSWKFQGQAPPARDTVALRLVNNLLGQQVGRLYVERHFDPATRAEAEALVAYLRRAFAERLSKISWMDEATRAEAQAKLARFKFKVGFPNHWRDVSDLTIRADDAAGNLRRIREADWAHQLRRLAPGNPEELWYQTPQTVDASYSVLLNTIELPAAYLQAPYFDASADPAVNFGAIGGIIGHEMSHAFDDQGIVYDSNGDMRDWWSPESLAHFHTRTNALVEQYAAFSPYENVHIDGRRTIGENIADLSGLSLAHHAYQLYLADHPCEGRTSLDGLSGEQRFFLSWAQAWRYKAPESAIRWVIDHGYHVPAPYRVNGVVRNMDAWYAAFGVTENDALYLSPTMRVRIW